MLLHKSSTQKLKEAVFMAQAQEVVRHCALLHGRNWYVDAPVSAQQERLHRSVRRVRGCRERQLSWSIYCHTVRTIRGFPPPLPDRSQGRAFGGRGLCPKKDTTGINSRVLVAWAFFPWQKRGSPKSSKGQGKRYRDDSPNSWETNSVENSLAVILAGVVVFSAGYILWRLVTSFLVIIAAALKYIVLTAVLLVLVLFLF